MDRREMNVDWLGRLLGLLGILVGSTACVYFYNQNATRRTEIADAVTKINRASDAKDASQTEADDFDAGWDQRLRTALEDFKDRGNKAIDKEDRNHLAREELFREELAKIALAENDLESLVQQKIEELQTQLAAPQLRVAQSWKKPLSAADAGLVMIKNDGDHEAQLNRVTFTPKSAFETDLPLSMESGLPTVNQLVVRFTREHNTATESDRHAPYERDFVEPEIVPGDSYAQLRIEIENASHLGWGFEGDLLIQYDDGRTLAVPNVQALFVAGSEDSA